MTGGTTRADMRQRDRQHHGYHGTHLEDEMPCCPDVYFCPTAGELECPRHGGFDVCCDQPGKHEPVNPADWHRAEAADERAWLDAWARTGITA
jgi:hypothetical protein